MRDMMGLKKEDIDTPEKRGRYTVSVVGCGRMGLPTACLFAEAGFKVISIDVNQYIIKTVNSGKSPFTEPELEPLLRKNLKEKRFRATSNFKESIPLSDVIKIIVPTTVDENKRANYLYVEKACRDVGLNMREGALIIFESTSGPGVTETLVKETLEINSGLKAGEDFAFAYSPIRATAGRVIEDITNYPRVLSAINGRSLKAAKLVLSTVVKGGIVEVSNIKTAEAVKLFENIYRDVNIALANDLARFCEKAGIDFIEVQRAANTQPYCHLLVPGIVSGHIPTDPYLLVEEAVNLNVKLRMVLLSRKLNDGALKHAFYLVRDALSSCGRPIRRAMISVLGVSYRPNVKESRGSLVRELIEVLQEKSVSVRVFDPFFSYRELIELGYPAERTLTRTVKGTDCLLIAVGHDRFRRLSLRRLKVLMRKPSAIVDLGHVLDPLAAEKEGFVYRGLGRGVWTR